MISKFVIVSFLVAIAAASVVPSEEKSTDLVFDYEESSHLRANERYHIIMGNRLDGDILQFEERIQVQPGTTVRFNIDQSLTINSVIVVDMSQSPNGDYPVPVDGGIGQKYVSLRFLSEYNKNVDFYVAIYAH